MNEIAAKALFDDEVARLSPRLLAMRRWEIITREYPLLEVAFHSDGRQPLLLRMRFTRWNAEPPAVELLSLGGQPLPKPLQGGPGIFNPSPHPTTKQPFICMAGVREYHTHPSHLNDPWDSYRSKSGYDLGGIITQIWNGWLKTPP